MKPGYKINFPEGNQIRLDMDHRLWRCVPHDVDFFFEREIAGGFYVELWADGYGGGIYGRPGSYGNGSIFVKKVDLPTDDTKLPVSGIDNYLNELIEKTGDTWKDIDPEKYLDEVRGYAESLTPEIVDKIAEEVEAQHPYKIPGRHETFDRYNEGWADACSVLADRIKEALNK